MNKTSVFYCFWNNVTYGPYSLDVFVEQLRQGTYPSTVLYSVDGRPWMALQDLPEYTELLALMSHPESMKISETPLPELEDEVVVLPEIVEDDEEEEEPLTFEDDELIDEDDADTSPTVDCPHCWCRFHFSRINYIARHPSLTGDPVLGAEAQTRFLPMKFNADGLPLDAKGVVCNEMACPRCHLQIPAVLFQDGGAILSTVGAPSSGKSYYLTAMMHQAKRTLLKFGYSLNDADTIMNMVLTKYEGLLFQNSHRSQYVSLPKTELQGSEFSTQVTLNGISIDLPLPFVYSLENDDGHAKNIIFYDNAGEHFEPGRDNVSNLATNHLVKSEAIFFLFDPFKDSELVESCDGNDPQANVLLRNVNQHQILQEMILRIRKKTGTRNDAKLGTPLVLIVPKFDAWKQNFTLDIDDMKFLGNDAEGKCFLNVTNVLMVSYALRQWLSDRLAEVVALCEKSFETVYYVPVSALGRMPEMDQENHVLGVKPDHLKPFWCEVPLLLYCWWRGLIPGAEWSYGEQATDVSSYCRWSDGELRFLRPGFDDVMRIPRIFWGREVYDNSMGMIRFPEPPEDMRDKEAVNADKDFWTE